MSKKKVWKMSGKKSQKNVWKKTENVWKEKSEKCLKRKVRKMSGKRKSEKTPKK